MLVVYMKIKMRSVHSKGFTRIENDVSIKEVMINEDFLHPESESIALGFKTKDSSGIIEFTTQEFENIMESVRKKTHLIKGFQLFGLGGTIKVEKKK